MLKSHDYHILVKQLLPLALRCSLPIKVFAQIAVELFNFDIELCSKEYRAEDYHNLVKKIAILSLGSKSSFLRPFLCYGILNHTYS